MTHSPSSGQDGWLVAGRPVHTFTLGDSIVMCMGTPPHECPCGSGRPCSELRDGQGIFCGYVCDKCEEQKRRQFRPEILDKPYTQLDVDEPIDPEPDVLGREHHGDW